MRKAAIILLAGAVLAASPALAQGRGGGAGGGHGGGPGAGMGGGPGGGLGAGPPMTVPGRTDDPRGTAADIASQRGQFGRDFAQDRRMTQAETAQLMRERAENFRAASATRRAEALARAEAAREGRPVGQSAKEIRAQLREDMIAWREAFGIGRSDWQAMRDQWLADKDSLTPEEWAARRAAWFEARDRWIADQKFWAQSHGEAGDGDSGG